MRIRQVVGVNPYIATLETLRAERDWSQADLRPELLRHFTDRFELL
jgi:hypothetical protein